MIQPHRATARCAKAFNPQSINRSPGVLVKIFKALVCSVAVLGGFPAMAQQIALAPENPDCAADEPDMVQVSWNAPCEDGNWLFEPGVGCRMWDWHPDAHDKALWTGTCRSSLKEGHGVIQWTEHGQPIDRFEGTYRNGRREGPGRYVWNERDRFEGTYAQDVPNGFGTVTVGGTTLSGEWRNGCLTTGGKKVAIGVSLESCGPEAEYLTEMAELPNQPTLK
jgi:hypothetical protein